MAPKQRRSKRKRNTLQRDQIQRIQLRNIEADSLFAIAASSPSPNIPYGKQERNISRSNSVTPSSNPISTPNKRIIIRKRNTFNKNDNVNVRRINEENYSEKYFPIMNNIMMIIISNIRTIFSCIFNRNILQTSIRWTRNSCIYLYSFFTYIYIYIIKIIQVTRNTIKTIITSIIMIIFITLLSYSLYHYYSIRMPVITNYYLNIIFYIIKYITSLALSLVSTLATSLVSKLITINNQTIKPILISAPKPTIYNRIINKLQGYILKIYNYIIPLYNSTINSILHIITSTITAYAHIITGSIDDTDRIYILTSGTTILSIIIYNLGIFNILYIIITKLFKCIKWIYKCICHTKFRSKPSNDNSSSMNVNINNYIGERKHTDLKTSDIQTELNILEQKNTDINTNIPEPSQASSLLNHSSSDNTSSSNNTSTINNNSTNNNNDNNNPTIIPTTIKSKLPFINTNIEHIISIPNSLIPHPDNVHHPYCINHPYCSNIIIAGDPVTPGLYKKACSDKCLSSWDWRLENPNSNDIQLCNQLLDKKNKDKYIITLPANKQSKPTDKYLNSFHKFIYNIHTLISQYPNIHSGLVKRFIITYKIPNYLKNHKELITRKTVQQFLMELINIQKPYHIPIQPILNKLCVDQPFTGDINIDIRKLNSIMNQYIETLLLQIQYIHPTKSELRKQYIINLIPSIEDTYTHIIKSTLNKLTKYQLSDHIISNINNQYKAISNISTNTAPTSNQIYNKYIWDNLVKIINDTINYNTHIIPATPATHAVNELNILQRKYRELRNQNNTNTYRNRSYSNNNKSRYKPLQYKSYQYYQRRSPYSNNQYSNNYYQRNGRYNTANGAYKSSNNTRYNPNNYNSKHNYYPNQREPLCIAGKYCRDMNCKHRHNCVYKGKCKKAMIGKCNLIHNKSDENTREKYKLMGQAEYFNNSDETVVGINLVTEPTNNNHNSSRNNASRNHIPSNNNNSVPQQ